MPRSVKTDYPHNPEALTFFSLDDGRKADVLKAVRTEGAVDHELGERAGKGYYTHQVEMLSRVELKKQRRATVYQLG